MDGTSRTKETDDGSELVSAHATSPGRTVFTETGNADGWIATDTTVDLAR